MIKPIKFFMRQNIGVLIGQDVEDITDDVVLAVTGGETLSVSTEHRSTYTERYSVNITFVRIQSTPNIVNLLRTSWVDACLWENRVWSILEYNEIDNLRIDVVLGASQ